MSWANTYTGFEVYEFQNAAAKIKKFVINKQNLKR